MSDTFDFNGLTYAVTSALIPQSPRAREAGVLFNFSMAVVDRDTGRKQIALNNLSLVRRVNQSTGDRFLSINSPKFEYIGGFCRAVVFMPGNDEINTRNDFISKLMPVLERAAARSMRRRIEENDE